MTRAISTSAKPIGYYCVLPPHIEDVFGSHFENLERSEQFALLAALTRYIDYAVAADDSNPDGYSLFDAYMDCYNTICLVDLSDILIEIEQLPDGTVLSLCEALIAHLLYTTEVQR
ncbi:MAG TPA: hypothetical protein V6D48_14400 [Oculatellaceae cyanobacterium]